MTTKDANDIDTVEDMDPSVMSQQDDQAANQPSEKDGQQSDAGASSAPNGDKEVDTASIVRDVVNEARGVADAGSPPEGEAANAPVKEVDDENFTDVPFHKHKRFQQVLGRMKASEADAVRYRNVDSFLTNNGITGDEAADVLQIVALSRFDAPAAWQRMRPFVEQVLRAAGEILPDELVQQVNGGHMTLEYAQQLSRAQAKAEGAVRANQHREALGQRQQQRNVSDAVNDAVGTWQSERELRDPNFAAKLPEIEKEIVWMHAKEGRPNTLKGVTDQLNRAYKTVSAKFATPSAPQQRQQVPQQRSPTGQFQPQRKTIAPITGGQSKANVPASGSMETIDIVRANRRKVG